MRVYVCYLDYGYEGKSAPLHAFFCPKQASAWVQGTEDSSGTRGKVEVLEVIDPASLGTIPEGE